MQVVMPESNWKAAEPGKPMNKIRVMIIDEHLAVRRALAARLASFPNIDVVATARNCQEGVERAQTNPPDVILMELKGKNCQKPDAVAEMKRALPENTVGVIVLTSYTDDEEKQAAIQAGANRYLLKNIDSASLTAEIEAVAKEALDQSQS
jgi:DNA-binding NarL/FixJ family response regulator